MARKADRVAAASRRYQQAIEAHAQALQRGDEASIERTSEAAEKARKRLNALVSTVRPIVGAAGGAALGGGMGALGGPGLAMAGSAAGAFIGGVLASPRAAKSKTFKPDAEIRQLKNKLLR